MYASAAHSPAHPVCIRGDIARQTRPLSGHLAAPTCTSHFRLPSVMMQATSMMVSCSTSNPAWAAARRSQREVRTGVGDCQGLGLVVAGHDVWQGLGTVVPYAPLLRQQRRSVLLLWSTSAAAANVRPNRYVTKTHQCGCGQGPGQSNMHGLPLSGRHT